MLYFQSVKQLTYKLLPFLPCFKKDSQGSEFLWLFLLGKFYSFKIYGKCWIMNCLLQPACAIFFLHFLYKCLTYKSCRNMLERVYFYPRVFQFSTACRVAGEATLMILISQTVWIQTGILPLQLLLSIWRSPSLVCLSHSSSLCHVLSSLTSTCAVGFIVSSFIVSLFVSRCSPSSSCLTLCAGK